MQDLRRIQPSMDPCFHRDDQEAGPSAYHEGTLFNKIAYICFIDLNRRKTGLLDM